jgi:hypothetical protein
MQVIVARVAEWQEDENAMGRLARTRLQALQCEIAISPTIDSNCANDAKRFGSLREHSSNLQFAICNHHRGVETDLEVQDACRGTAAVGGRARQTKRSAMSRDSIASAVLDVVG